MNCAHLDFSFLNCSSSIIKKVRIANEAATLVNEKEDVVLLERKKRLEEIEEIFQNSA